MKWFVLLALIGCTRSATNADASPRKSSVRAMRMAEAPKAKKGEACPPECEAGSVWCVKGKCLK